jgi:mannosyl-oligosaccharide alpha-1,2-mannosidase
LAEIGSLSVEFTRLAQLTGEAKWYDAIARITDEFAEFQDKTRLPGMWPTFLDASGCKRIDWMTELNKPLQKPLPVKDTEQVLVDDIENLKGTPLATKPLKTPASTDEEQLSPGGNKYIPLDLPEPVVLTPNGMNPTWTPEIERPNVWKGGNIKKRQLDIDEPEVPLAEATPPPTAADFSTPVTTPPVCDEQGFAWSSDYGHEEYTLGGMSDSTYEYLPKEYMLLGGQVEKYKTMYLKSIEVVKKYLIFRPMLPDGMDILMSGKILVPSSNEHSVGDHVAENQHLTCFAGGMFGLGAKLFDRPADLDIARKLTEGCIWSYNMTTTGIMPESFELVACEDRKDCPWNETRYYNELDPRAAQRMEYYEDAMKIYESQMAVAMSSYNIELAKATAKPTPTAKPVAPAGIKVDPLYETLARPTPTYDVLGKRQLPDALEELDAPEPIVPDPNERPAPKKAPVHVAQHAEEKSATPKQTPTYNKNPHYNPNESGPGGAAGKPHYNPESGPESAVEKPPTKVQRPLDEEQTLAPSPTLPEKPSFYSPKAPLSHKDYVKNRILEGRLPMGVVQINERGYILR